ncbi:MAG: class II fructose-bisphosphate aldolase [Patescibacteria group bacterium]
MPLVNLAPILARPHAEHYAVGAFNDVNGLFVRPILAAAGELGLPVILMVAEVHFDRVALEGIAPYLLHLASRADVPVAVMLDHCASLETAQRAVRCGFTAVMYDGSRLPYEENLAKTRQVVELAHAVGVSVEGELGHVAGHEGGARGGVSGEVHTDPALAEDFARRTGVDCLAVSIGTRHGVYEGEVRLDFARLREIRARVDLPLVLHGGSGLSDEDFRSAAACGVSKINYYTYMSLAATRAARAFLDINPGDHDLPRVMDECDRAVRSEVRRAMTVFARRGE